jgi:hypothetical protein
VRLKLTVVLLALFGFVFGDRIVHRSRVVGGSRVGAVSEDASAVLVQGGGAGGGSCLSI